MKISRRGLFQALLGAPIAAVAAPTDRIAAEIDECMAEWSRQKRALRRYEWPVKAVLYDDTAMRYGFDVSSGIPVTASSAAESYDRMDQAWDATYEKIWRKIRDNEPGHVHRLDFTVSSAAK